MTTQRPYGVIVEIEHKGKTYYGFLGVDFDREKVYGNSTIDIESFMLFDGDFNKLLHSEHSELYDELDPYIQRVVIDNEE